jgi:hypothetical protein
MAKAPGARLGPDRRQGFGRRRVSHRRGPGIPEAVPLWVEGSPAAAQPLGWLAGVAFQESLEFLGGQGSHRQAAALVHGCAQRLQVLVLVAVRVRVVGVGVVAHALLPSAS